MSLRRAALPVRHGELVKMRATLVSRPKRAYASEEPGPRGHTTRCCGSGYGASRFSRWVPDLVALAQVRSLHSSGTRGRGVTRCKPTSSPAGLTRGSIFFANALSRTGSQKCFSRSGWIAGSSPAMTGGKGPLTRAKRSAASASRMPSLMLTRITCRSRICGNGRRAGTIVTQNKHEETPCGHLA
jgi:hypothetical protein